VLDADVEADRREFTLVAAIAVAAGERLALFGPSGAGKTTLLEIIAGLVAPRRGRVSLAGRLLTCTADPVVFVPPWRRRVGLLRQDPGLFPHLSVAANLMYAPTTRGDKLARAELAQIAGQLGLAGLLAAMPARLSGGQAHRVALGRLLLAHCDTLLLDEPYSGLDAELRRTLTELVSALVAERAIPAVLVAHELADAQAFADRLVIIDAGRLLQDGAPDEVVLRPASRRVAELVGYRGFVPVQRPAGETLLAGVHPERVVAGDRPGAGIVLTGVVRASRPSGAAWEADLEAGAALVTVRLGDRPPPAGRVLTVTALAPPCFGPDGAAVPVSGAAWPVQAGA
jgi:molybdate transport system ATP-binding protein